MNAFFAIIVLVNISVSASYYQSKKDNYPGSGEITCSGRLKDIYSNEDYIIGIEKDKSLCIQNCNFQSHTVTLYGVGKVSLLRVTAAILEIVGTGITIDRQEYCNIGKILNLDTSEKTYILQNKKRQRIEEYDANDMEE